MRTFDNRAKVIGQQNNKVSHSQTCSRGLCPRFDILVLKLSKNHGWLEILFENVSRYITSFHKHSNGSLS